MRTLTYVIGTTLDGQIAGPDGEIDFFPVGADMLDFLVAELPDTLPTPVRAATGLDAPPQRFDTVVMGRETFEPALAVGLTNPYPHLRQIVVSTTLESPDPAVEVHGGDPVELVRELKGRDGRGIYLAGGGRLAAALADEIDELIVKVYPVLAGSGRPMLGGGFAPTQLQRTGLVELEGGAVVLTYARA